MALKLEVHKKTVHNILGSLKSELTYPGDPKNKVEDEKLSKREEIRAAAELARTKRREVW